MGYTPQLQQALSPFLPCSVDLKHDRQTVCGELSNEDMHIHDACEIYVNVEGDGTFMVYEPNCDGHQDGTTGYQPTSSMDGTDTLVPTDRLFRQSTSSFGETNPVLRDTVLYDLGEFDGEASLFDLTSDEMVKIEVYIWLEGMDVDCVNAIGRGSLIFANLQFLAEPHQQSGMEPIE